MEVYSQNPNPTPGSVGSNRYVKTSQYGVEKVIRSVVKVSEMALKAIISLLVDVIKGILGKS